MSNPWAKTYSDLRKPYFEGKMAKKDYDGDGKVESGAKEYRGVVHNKIQQAKGGKADGKDTSSVKEMKEPPRMQKGAMAYDGPNKERSLAADRVLQKAKEKRKKMKKEHSNWRNELGYIEEASKGDKLDIKTNVKNKINVNPDLKTEHHQKDAEGNVVDHDEEEIREGKAKACWDTHKKVGMKMKGGKLVNDCRPKNEEVKPMTSVTGDGSKLSPLHQAGGPNSQFNKDGTPKVKKVKVDPKLENYMDENFFKNLMQNLNQRRINNAAERNKPRDLQGTPLINGKNANFLKLSTDAQKRFTNATTQKNSYEPQGDVILEKKKKDKKGKGSGKKDACYHKVKAASDVWPSAYASGRLVQCRKVGAANYGKSKSKKEETLLTQVEQEALKLFNEKTN